MSLELLKIVVQPVVLERDGDGKITGERVGEATAIFQVDQLQTFVEQLQQEIVASNGKQ